MNMQLKDVFKVVIEGLSSNINMKALNEVLEGVTSDNLRYNDLNELLYNYYMRAHYRKNDFHFKDFISSDDFSNLDEFKDYVKNEGAKWYKKMYDYNINNLQPIKQKNTKMVMVYSNGFYNHVSYLFNMYEFIQVNNIKIEVI